MGESRSGSRGAIVSGDKDDARASDSNEDDGEEGLFGFVLFFSVLILLAFVAFEPVVALFCTVLGLMGSFGPYARASCPSPF
ncbi:hypothetical protein SUGI_0354480 [Cryptomeria japonica]|nr:hypothetical protein SUGI_0354480 [Cryptomeria japonica]